MSSRRPPEQKPPEQKPLGLTALEQKLPEHKLSGREVSESTLSEHEHPEPELFRQIPVEQKPPEQKPHERIVPEQKPPEQKPSEERLPEKPAAPKGKVAENPFLVADRVVRRSQGELETTSQSALEAKHVLSDCVPSRKDYIPPPHHPSEQHDESPNRATQDIGRGERSAEARQPRDYSEQSTRGLPKVRASSPPTWLKNPSAKPGSIQGKLQPVETKGSPPESRVQEDGSPVPDLSELRSNLKNAPPQTREVKKVEFPPVQLKKVQPNRAGSAPISQENLGTTVVATKAGTKSRQPADTEGLGLSSQTSTRQQRQKRSLPYTEPESEGPESGLTRLSMAAQASETQSYDTVVNYQELPRTSRAASPASDTLRPAVRESTALGRHPPPAAHHAAEPRVRLERQIHGADGGGASA